MKKIFILLVTLICTVTMFSINASADNTKINVCYTTTENSITLTYSLSDNSYCTKYDVFIDIDGILYEQRLTNNGKCTIYYLDSATFYKFKTWVLL